MIDKATKKLTELQYHYACIQNVNVNVNVNGWMCTRKVSYARLRIGDVLYIIIYIYGDGDAAASN